MPPEPWTVAAPERLLLATDLSARCDRATERALQLAQQWNCELVALTVIERPQMPDQALDWLQQEGDPDGERYARRLLWRDLQALGPRARIEILRGDVAQAIRSRAEALDAPLVVLGVARDEPFGRLLAGSAAEELARSPTPLLLMVRNRAHDPYGRILVATDFSEASRAALQAALRLFPAAEIVLYHAHALAFAGMVADSASRQAALAVEQDEAPRFLAASDLAPADRARIRIVVEPGSVELMAARYVRRHDIPLAVVGSRGRSAIAQMLLGSSAAKLLEWLPCDTLLVRAGA